MAQATKLQLIAALSLLLLIGCYPEHDPGAKGPGTGGSGASPSASGGTGGSAASGGMAADGSGGDTGGNSGGTDGTSTAICPDAVGSPLPARLAITSTDPGSGSGGGAQIISVTKESLFREFERQTCGNPACHGGADMPSEQSPNAFRMTLSSFDQRSNLGSQSLDRILSSDPNKVMPPGSGDGSTRGENDPVRRLGERLLAWEDAGFPEAFDIVLENEPPSGGLPTRPYHISQDLGSKLTNLGSCIPHRTLSLNSPLMLREEMQQKDELFESLETSDDLPDTLVETDLISLESAELAKRGVYSYAPTYNLFSDHAGKMRYVRVPVGQTIRYNPQTKDFDIPDNTRFYKTFLKEVRDQDGNIGHRKMETRLIVVRKDEQLPGGGFRPRALRTTYVWDKDEAMAVRITDPLRNGQAFADRLCPYIVDESAPRDPKKNPISDEMSEYCGYMTAEELADPGSGQIRHYAIPSAERCDQCHMGSNNRSYILGFGPWQVDRRPAGEGGTYDAASKDELSQLARLLDYGVITGIAPGEAKLEASQGVRSPRNDAELKAQAYMIGNCAFCHNPNGFPVVQNPLLAPFNLYPDEDHGGIFQFSLERYSPRAKAGQDQAFRYPYITPALGDFDLGGPDLDGEGRASNKVIGWGWSDQPPVRDATEEPPDYWIVGGAAAYFEFLGQWRSLVWRNVYTPFTYNEDFTIFVHMPRNVAGYDCRAHNIMAEWMLSIPATPKTEPLPGCSIGSSEIHCQHHQPMLEVRPGERGYPASAESARIRLETFRNSVTGQHCPTDDDIVDPKVVASPVNAATGKKRLTIPLDEGAMNGPRVAPDLPLPLKDFVPDHAHWVPTDTTDLAGRWQPRRFNWKEMIATRELAPGTDKLADVIDDLQTVHLSSEQELFSLDPVPLGTWSLECENSANAASSPTVGEMRKDSSGPMRRWLHGGVFEADGVRDEARVHSMSRGEAVFQSICQNCHGTQLDSRSPLAATILELSGGQTRVANFLDGLFGPTAAPGAFARDEFLINLGASYEDWQARYVLFMGLGGTEANIPQAVIDLVAVSSFYGRPATASTKDPNMLDSAEQRCLQVLNNPRQLPKNNQAGIGRPMLPYLVPSNNAQGFAPGTGHYELWESLCTYRNEPVVHVFNWLRSSEAASRPQSDHGGLYRAMNDSGEWVYPPDHPVGNQLGGVDRGISEENTLPWCVEVEPETRQDILDYFEKYGLQEGEMPLCPPPLLSRAFGHRIHKLTMNSNRQIDHTQPLGNQAFAEGWIRRGAMSAGIAAFYYMDRFTKGLLQPAPPFDVCDK